MTIDEMSTVIEPNDSYVIPGQDYHTLCQACTAGPVSGMSITSSGCGNRSCVVCERF